MGYEVEPPLLQCAQHIVNFSRGAFALTVKMPGLVSGVRRDRFSNGFAVKFCLSDFGFGLCP